MDEAHDEAENPFAAASTTQLPKARSSTGFMKFLLVALTIYYVLSFLTLPLADDVWLDELPLFAIWQVPKSWIFSSVRGWMVDTMFQWGIDKGSASPTAIAATPWAFAVMFIVPGLFVLTLARVTRNLRKHWRWVALLVVAATIDALVSLWFEEASSLSVF